MYFLQKGAACLLAATVVAALGGCAAPGEEESRLYKYMTSLRSEFPYRDSNPGAAIVWGSRVYDDGVRYEGEFNNGKRHGRGKQIWPDGAEYEGEYQNDKRNGQGTFTWPSKAKYEGDFVDGKRHGKGVFTWPNGA
ncbi:MAG TPA: hypothetical protein HPQ00_16655, partial [Magnetococcales bacterium]|nr:hypothetical protein [Magnetococcales bacterium]